MAFIAIIACISMAACSNKIDVPVADDEQDIYTVKIGWSGEILDIKDEPLSRATTNDLYGIQVYSTPDKELEEGEEVEWTKYAYGLFDDPDAISVNLLKGYKYKFVATMVVDGKNKIYSSSNKFSVPFATTGDVSGNTLLSNDFNYSSSSFFYSFNSGLADAKENEDYKQRMHPNVDRYYGKLEGFIPTANSNISIPMKRVSFGATFVAINSVGKNGTLEIQIEKAPKMEIAFTEESDEFSVKDIFTFEDVAAAYAKDDYTETIPVTINWHRADGTTVPLGAHDITYKRNRNTIVTVKITNAGADSDLGFSIDESEQTDIEDMEKGDDVTIENGEVVEVDLSWFNPNQYISYVSNYETKSNADPNATDYYYHCRSYITWPNISFSKIECKFEINTPPTTWNDDIVVCGPIYFNDVAYILGEEYSWSELNSEITDCMVLNISLKDKSIKLNGNNIDYKIDSSKSSYSTSGLIFSDYYRDYDEGEYKKWSGVPVGSKLYYIKLWDENDELIYLGAASTALNPTTNEVENCWRSYYNETTTYQFAHNSETLSNYQPYGGGTDE